MNKHIIAGTAGHIDHGKTSLIRALTGIDTDRLKEEKERGITTELGFAHFRLPGGAVVGIVDVPGHEKFVRHMVAGAAGIDLVMLVIAGDEGIMPQTREHLDICRMLGIRRGLVALTKKDLCEPDWLELVAEEVRQFVAGTFLGGEPIIPVSSQTGEGIPELAAALDRLVSEIEPRPPWGIFRMPVDRVFTMKGFGTVVTGTTTSGTVKVGELVRLYPGETETRVRGLQVHGATVDMAEAGCRTAVNLQGMEKEQVARGDVIGHPGQLVPSYIMDVRLHLLRSSPRPVENRTRIRFHIGTSELLGRVHLLETEKLEPGKEGLAQVRLERPTVALARDRFVIRSYSPASTIGGGIVIDPAAAKYLRKKSAADAVQKLAALEKGSPQEALLAALLHEGTAGATVQSLSRSLNIDEKAVAADLSRLSETGSVRRSGEGSQDPLFHARSFQILRETVQTLLSQFHSANPLKAGISREELRTKLPKNLPPKGLLHLMAVLAGEGTVATEGETIRLASFRVTLDPRQQEMRTRLEAGLKKSGLAVPSPAELSQDLRIPQTALSALIGLLVDEGTLVKINDDIYLHREPFRNLRADIESRLASRGELTVPEFKEMTGLSRKYTIPLLEHFDRIGVTLRVGDKRVAKGR